ncbi:MAG TPA: hypothetical protein PK239_14150 [Chitinophagales bacterium]|nr:hypothetical protein [Chitinophagales bacterium]
MKPTHIIVVFLGILPAIALLCLSACECCNSGSINSETGDVSDTTSAVTALKKVTLTIDASGSMKGYMYSGTTEFYQNIASRLVKTIGSSKGKYIDATEFKFWGTTNPTYTDAGDFLQKLVTPTFTERTSNIIKTLKDVAASISEGDLRIFITDGVFIPDNAGSSKYSMEGEIGAYFGSNVFKDNSTACYVFASKSAYQTRNRYPTQLQRYPYYLFIVGKNKDISLFMKHVVKPSQYEFEELLIVNATLTNSFIGADNSITNNPGDWEFVTKPQSNNDYLKINSTKAGVKFAFLLDMFSFAPKDSKNLANMVEVEMADTVVVYTKDKFINSLYAPMDKGKYNKATHVVLVEYKSPPIGQNCILKFKNNDTWYNAWTHDKSGVLEENKTEGIIYLLRGIAQAQDPNNPTIIVSLPIKS